MPNRLIKLKPVSSSNVLSECGQSFAQMNVIPINGLADGSGVAVDRSGVVYVSDMTNHVIFRCRPGQTSVIFAGAMGVSGNADGQGSAARFNKPYSICADRRGNILVIDLGNALVRRVDENGNVRTVAAIPPEAMTDIPGQIAVDDSDNIYFVDNTV
jgi:sugar lactone lactonase YvrE